jgi:squalene-hopene/tetraprenyl-beta-curcumene cyclase
MMCAICGTLGEKGWKLVLQLPFQLAAFPRKWFGAMRLPVVSYALPALIAIGYARHRKVGTKWPHPLWPRLSELLKSIQPGSGGFLEAAPLTSFVTMALVEAGEKDHAVARKGVEFLLDTVRADGSWPIDTNLATWATTLSIKALLGGRGKDEVATQQGWVDDQTLLDQREPLLEWLLGQQYREVHPFTDSPPGGWAWTDLSGGVPDADDTPGAMLALHLLDGGNGDPELICAASNGAEWLLGLQNRDGGIPTFCRGWGALPFDRSSPDLTAHTLRAWRAWYPLLSRSIRDRIDGATGKALRYLKREQRADGSWVPLWFGNQHRTSDEENPTYGTSMVVRAMEELGREDLAAGGVEWLCDQQNPDGGWGSGAGLTPSTIEETALAVSALAKQEKAVGAVERGVEWLIKHTEGGTRFESAPIGFYFARLWYFERIYPIVWTLEALTRAEAVDAKC